MVWYHGRFLHGILFCIVLSKDIFTVSYDVVKILSISIFCLKLKISLKVLSWAVDVNIDAPIYRSKQHDSNIALAEGAEVHAKKVFIMLLVLDFVCYKTLNSKRFRHICVSNSLIASFKTIILSLNNQSPYVRNYTFMCVRYSYETCDFFSTPLHLLQNLCMTVKESLKSLI